MMKWRMSLAVLFCMLLLTATPGQDAPSKDQKKNILILFARVPSSPAYKDILDGIRQKLVKAYDDHFNLHTEYLEVELYPQGAYPREKFGIFNSKYENVPLDLLIYIGIDIMPTIRQHAAPYLQNLPSICMDFDFSSIGHSSNLALNDRTVVIPLIIDADKCLRTALDLCPSTRKIFFISGASEADRLFYSVSMQVVEKFRDDYQIEFITGVSMDEAISRVRHLPDSSILVFNSFYLDSKQVPYFNPEAVRLLSSNANAPLFTYTEAGFGEGAVGGYIIRYSKAGLFAGDVAVRLLKGEDPANISCPPESCRETVFDQRQLKRWENVVQSALPRGSKVLYRENDFFSRYRWYFVSAMLFLVFQTLLIFRLVVLNRKQKQMTLQLVESESKFRDLVREDRILRIGQLTASLSHELNQPLTAILSTAQAGLKFLDTNNADPVLLKEILQNIVEDDKRTASILSSIRGMLKLETREKEKVDLNKLIEELIAIYRSEAMNQGIYLNVRLLEKPVFVFADPIQVQQVMMNFMTNAAHSMKNSREKKIDIFESVENDKVTVYFRDYGDGIPENLKDKIFKPFVTTRDDGFGIGLAISKSIIDAHQGVIHAENKPGGGAEFSFSLNLFKDGKQRV